MKSGLGPMVCLTALAALPAGAATPALEEPIRLPAQSVPPGQAVTLTLPALPAKPGKVILLRLRAVIRTATVAGCNYNASLRLNDHPIGRYTAAGDERLVGRDPSFEFATGHEGTSFPALAGTALMMLFAPDVNQGDAATKDGLGATFLLDITDIARGVDGNTLTLRNNLKEALPGGFGDLVVEDLAVGWVDRAALPQPPTAVPERGALADGITVGNLRLSQGKAGGFALRVAEGVELLVETTVGMKGDAPSLLLAEDGVPGEGAPKLRVGKWGPAGYRLEAAWPALRLERTLEIGDGLVRWKERWTNTGDQTWGVPFRHRCFLRGEAARFWVGGSPENASLASSAQNPTLYLDSPTRRGHGVGITAESDWLRLLMWLRARTGVGELYSETLALAPGKSIDFELTLTPVRDGGGYWSFINSVRRRWGVNGTPMPRPMFLGYSLPKGEGTPAEKLRRALGHLGPITVVLGPWQRLEPDARVVTAGKYPRLPEGAPRAPGACPDLDIDAWLTLQHREAYWEQLGKEAAAIRAACPNAQVMQMMHPSMETVYKPLQDRWPIAQDIIRTAAGEAFEDAGYSKAWLYGMVEKDWGVLYYVPRPGSAYLEELLKGMRRALDQYRLDGIYCDEFSWAYSQRGYSRYDYSRWDGFSADLDADGSVLRLKCDNAFVTESAQLRMLHEVLSRGKFFLGNGASALRSVNSLPIQRFIEGGNGPSNMGFGHLSAVPLVLGNLGDETTRKGVFESVRLCLSAGCIYSPMAVNLLLEGPDNFVCKLYPITVRELGAGFVIGEERLVTTVSGSYAWPGRAASVRRYIYDADGNLQPVAAPRKMAARQKLDVKVPDKGLVIAEVVTK